MNAHAINARSFLAGLRETMRDCQDRETLSKVARELRRLANELTEKNTLQSTTQSVLIKARHNP
jgi:hypothetical protein